MWIRLGLIYFFTQNDIQNQLRIQKAKWATTMSDADRKLMEQCAIYQLRHPQPTAPPPKLSGPVASSNLGQTYLCHVRKDNPGEKCASKSVNHPSPYYDSGKMNHECPSCEALLLKSELKGIGEGKFAKCCAYGDVHTDVMKGEYRVNT